VAVVSYVDTGDATKGLIGSAAKWFFSRAVIYVAVALLSAGLFFAAASIYAWVQGPIQTPATAPTTIPAIPAVPTPALPPVLLAPVPNVAQVPELRLTAEDVALILAIIQPRPSPGGWTEYKLGQRAGANAGRVIPLLPMAVVEKVPQLRGFRYDIDAKGAVVIIDPRTYFVRAIIVAK
jgi:hypothetical protein